MVGMTKRDQMQDLLYQLEHRMGRTSNEPFRGFEWSHPETATGATWLPLVDIFEETDEIRLVAEVPGVRPEDVKISVEGNLLRSRARRSRRLRSRLRGFIAMSGPTAPSSGHSHWPPRSIPARSRRPTTSAC